MDTVPARAEYPIAAVSRMTGLSIDTLRAWERRYGAVTPTRDRRGRLYSARDVARLKALAALVAEGHAIGRIAGRSYATLRRLSGPPEPPDPAPAGELPGIRTLRQALDQYDIDAIEATLNRHALLLPPPELIFRMVLPALCDVGTRWASGTICTAHEHLMSNAIRNMLGGLLHSLTRDARGPAIVFATPAGQRHELGLLCGAALAAWAGRSVIYLGADVPAGDIARAVGRVNARTLVLASTVEQPDAAAVADLTRLPRAVKVLAGGAHARGLSRHLGARVRVIESLEDFHTLLGRPAGRRA